MQSIDETVQRVMQKQGIDVSEKTTNTGMQASTKRELINEEKVMFKLSNLVLYTSCLLLCVAVWSICWGVGFLTHHFQGYTPAEQFMLKMKDTDFKQSDLDKLTVNTALVTPSSHVLISAPKGKFILYCISSTDCVKAKEMSDKQVIYAFADIMQQLAHAARDRAAAVQQPPVAPTGAPITQKK